MTYSPCSRYIPKEVSHTNSQLSIGKLFAKALKKAGIDAIFTLSGGHNMPILYAFRDDGIRVNAVAPGVTKTDMVANLPEEVIKPIIATIPLGRMGEPEDVANAFVFLASDMSSYVTGAVLPVDGAARS